MIPQRHNFSFLQTNFYREPQDKAQPAALAEVQQAEKKTKQQSDAAAFDSLNAVLKGEEELDAILDLI